MFKQKSHAVALFISFPKSFFGKPTFKESTSIPLNKHIDFGKIIDRKSELFIRVTK